MDWVCDKGFMGSGVIMGNQNLRVKPRVLILPRAITNEQPGAGKRKYTHTHILTPTSVHALFT